MKSAMMAMTAAAALSFAGTASAAVQHYSTKLAGPSEVPANDTKGTGKVEATLDTTTKTFSYKVTYSGLTGAPTMAHFHGPALAGVNAPPIIVVKDLPSPMKGTAVLTDVQIADLQAGKWYFNIHTSAHPGGEIRGQLAAGK
ncbi:MAG TPA: CHRD domain-containing protein [Caulobacteraceae bacterium]|jgi:hypothetical protein